MRGGGGAYEDMDGVFFKIFGNFSRSGQEICITREYTREIRRSGEDLTPFIPQKPESSLLNGGSEAEFSRRKFS